MSTPFVHLRLHTEFSLDDGLVRLKPLVKRAVELGYPALPLTDESNLFALVKFYKATQSAGIKPLIGSDFWLEPTDEKSPPARITLLAMDNTGYLNLTELISRAWLEGQQLGKAYLKFEWLAAQPEGLLALSGAKEGPIGQLLLAGHLNEAAELTQKWMQTLPNAFYLEVQRTARVGDEECLHASVKLAQQLNCPLVATNDVRFMERKDYWAHETRVCIGESRTLDDPRRKTPYSEEQYLKSPEEMQSLFSDLPSALTNSVEIAKRCNVEVRLGEYFLPKLPIEPGMTEDDYFRKKSHEGLTKRLEHLHQPRPENFAEIEKEYRDRLDFELDTIVQMGFPSYFLIVADFINQAIQDQVPVGPGRGSGAGSLVAYALNITDLDPLEYSLLFERFLNPERVSMPDFDIDFCMEGREKVINYVTQTYGREAVSQIVTFGTMAAKGVVRDVARAQGKPYAVGDRLSKAIPFDVGMTLAKAAEDVEELKSLETAYQAKLQGELSEQMLESLDQEGYEVWAMARELEGVARNTGKHAGGVVIAPSKLTDFAPVMADEEGKGWVVQFDKDDIEEAGLVKFDFLGLRTLTIIDRALKDINKNLQPTDENFLKITAIPLDDKKTFDLLKKAETTAVFQLESRGMKELIKKLKPDSLEDMIALVALFRPGPLQSGMVDDFIQRKHGLSPISYPHPDYNHESLKPVLEPTYGIILYQEQVMQIAQVMAGFTLGGADMLRRAMGKKKPEEMARMRQLFMEGSEKNGIDPTEAGQIFDLVEKFAGYGFNKSHSAAYGLVSYQTAWLKTHHPASFMAAVMSTEMNNTEKVVMLVEESRAMKLTITPPDVNLGSWYFTVNAAGEIVYGLGAIKGVGESPVEAIIEARNQGGPFSDLFDFCSRVDMKRLNKRAIDALIRSGALDQLATSRNLLLAALEDALKTADQANRNLSLGMDDLFGGLSSQDTSQTTDPYAAYLGTPQWTDKQRLAGEKDTLGLYLTGHPIDEYENELKRFVSKKIANLQPSRDSQRIAGLVMAFRTMKSKRGDTLAFMTLDDRSGRIEVSVMGEDYERFKSQLTKDALLILEGEVREDSFTGGLAMRCKDLTPIAEARSKFARALEIRFNEPTFDKEILKQLTLCLAKYKQDSGLALQLNYTCQLGKATLLPSDQWQVEPSDALLEDLNQLLGKESVRLVYLNEGEARKN
ncbi:DNA polymerase III subunit alpha [Marinospirillum insulare]|uniref:DNA polymerase III subunit alpha n=1 Tax=Marinospirillum insulare TaxID=217169 RepID=A0ABQ5ZYI5_9GAMM|nr:DNA polymerase III subunit alpha [Marinospirillum insulare]GLR63721.1 DNA-directed DNA polymerase [Marinospirillum insulare]